MNTTVRMLDSEQANVHIETFRNAIEMCRKAPARHRTPVAAAVSLHSLDLASMRGTMLGILSETGPVMIRSSPGADKPSSQDMALLGSLSVFADNLDLCVNQVCTSSTRISFARFVCEACYKSKQNCNVKCLSCLCRGDSSLLYALMGPEQSANSKSAEELFKVFSKIASLS